MSGSGRRIVVALALLAVVAGADSGTSRSQDVPRRERPVSAEREFTRQQVKIRRGQSLARRAMRDHRASPEVQQKAAELNTLLDHRQQVVAGLQKQHQEFTRSTRRRSTSSRRCASARTSSSGASTRRAPTWYG